MEILASLMIVLGDFKTAIDYHERHLKIAKEVGDRVEEGRAYGNLGNAYQSLEDFKKALEYHKRDLEIAKEVGDRAGKGMACGNLGNAYQNLRDFKTSIEFHERHLNIAKEVGDKAGTAISLYGLGKNFELQGSLRRALDHFHSSVKMFNIVMHDLNGKDEWKISYRDMYKIAYSSLWRSLLKQGEVTEALFAAEQGRAQALNDVMELHYGFEGTYCQFHTREESKFDSFSFLPSNSIAIFMAADERDVVLWVAQRGKSVALRKKEVQKGSFINLKDLLESIKVAVYQEIGVQAPQTPHKPVPIQTNALRTFYDIIIDPISDLIQGNEVILVPEGPLCLALYAAFVDYNGRYLCEVCRFRVIPSLSSLKRIRDLTAGYHSQMGVLLVGDPYVQEATSQGETLKRVPYARKEVEMIGRILNTKPLTGREAAKDEVLRRLPSVSLIHIAAAHGRTETGEIALAPNTFRASKIPAVEDFLLRIEDVISLQIRAKLVVLSWDNSGCGMIKAEGVVGIARAFLGAGARAVLVSLWSIDEKATLEFMKSFYFHVVKGKSACESLNRAIRCMRESDEFHKVKFWAPFMLIGDDVTLEFGASA